jgi:NAD(P)-dependent dehydrogenase (short-subunit alcohol dehydrogenase family)
MSDTARVGAGFDLAGKVVLVTGAARRIGRSIALRLHREGARVLIHYSSSQAEAGQTAAECGGAPLYRANLESVSEIKALFAEIAARESRLDALVNNAARFTAADPLMLTEADWDSIHDVNLKATFFCAQQAALLMRRNPGGAGRIVNMSSMGAFLAWPEHAHYCASKAGVVALTRVLAKALAPAITVNSVAPGVIPFDEVDEPRIQALARATPAGRPGTGEEIAAAVVYFLTASNFVTGQVLQVDGGLGLG